MPHGPWTVLKIPEKNVYQYWTMAGERRIIQSSTRFGRRSISVTAAELRDRRYQADIGLTKIARYLDVDQSHLARMERGERPMSEELAARYEAAVVEISTKRAVGAGLVLAA
jgi:hypothetical protein